MGFKRFLAVVGLATALAGPQMATAGDITYWDELRGQVFGERAMAQSQGEVEIFAPYRATDDREVPVTLQARLPEGVAIKTLSLIVDENPMPVSAVFDMETRRSTFEATMNMRLNGPSTLHAVLEAEDGRLFVTEAQVKTSGLGACAAPPVGDPEEALAALGGMDLYDVSSRAADGGEPALRRARLEIQHPNHTGLQMNQVTLLYILARYVQEVDVWVGDEKQFSLTGSISLSENPEIEFDYLRGDAHSVKVRVTDTEGAVFEEEFPIDGA